jgi:hypothetical protein
MSTSIIRIKKENVKRARKERQESMDLAGKGCTWPKEKASRKSLKRFIRDNKSNHIHTN